MPGEASAAVARGAVAVAGWTPADFCFLELSQSKKARTKLAMTKSAKNTDIAVNAARDGQVTTVVVSSELEPEPEPEIESCCHSNEGGPENATVEPAGKVLIVAGVNVTVPGCGSAPRRIRLVPVLTPTTVFVSEVPPSSSERYNTSPTLMPETSSTLTVVAPALMAVVVVEAVPAPAQHRTPLAWYESTEHCSFESFFRIPHLPPPFPSLVTCLPPPLPHVVEVHTCSESKLQPVPVVAPRSISSDVQSRPPAL